MKGERILGVHTTSGNLVPLASTPPSLSSAKTSWNGITLELHHLPPSESPELCLQQHSISIQLANPFQIDWRVAGGKLHTSYVRKGDVGIIVKGTPTQARWYKDIKFIILSLDDNLLNIIAEEIVNNDSWEICSKRGIRDSQILHLGMALKVEVEAGCPSGKTYGESIATALSAHLLKHYSIAGRLIPESDIHLPERQLHLVISYINDNLAQELSLAKLSTLIQMSTYSFCRWFKSVMGFSPHQYIIYCRLEKAKLLLSHTRLPIVEIALDVGCSSQSNFTALFRKQIGMTPKAYRENF